VIGVEKMEREPVRHAPDIEPLTYGKRTLLGLLKSQRRLNLSHHPKGRWRVRVTLEDVRQRAGAEPKQIERVN